MRMVFDTEYLTGTARIIYLAATAVLFAVLARPDPERNADDLIALLFKKQSRNSAVNSPGHSDDYFCHSKTPSVIM